LSVSSVLAAPSTLSCRFEMIVNPCLLLLAPFFAFYMLVPTPSAFFFAGPMDTDPRTFPSSFRCPLLAPSPSISLSVARVPPSVTNRSLSFHPPTVPPVPGFSFRFVVQLGLYHQTVMPWGLLRSEIALPSFPPAPHCHFPLETSLFAGC